MAWRVKVLLYLCLDHHCRPSVRRIRGNLLGTSSDILLRVGGAFFLTVLLTGFADGTVEEARTHEA